MAYLFVNKKLKTPHSKSLSAITKAIDEGVLSYNDKLPTEKEICKTFSISPTAKMAYEDLILNQKNQTEAKGLEKGVILL